MPLRGGVTSSKARQVVGASPTVSEGGTKGNHRRTVIITGNTRGIGRAIALRLARSGFNVVLSYSKDEEQAAVALQLCKEISQAGGPCQG
jgi:FlaA1/EpsC-like NDP-sugar epimerase